MSDNLDLNLLTLSRLAGHDQAEQAGLHIVAPPRRPARSRKADQLILFLAQAGNAPLSAAHQEQLLAKLGQAYYQTSGSVTSAMRSLAEALNKFLLDRNLRNASSGRQAIGVLTQVVVRSRQLYLAQSGPAHAFLLASEKTDHVYDPDTAGRGLGLSRTTSLKYFQASLEPNDTLVLAAQPDPTWTKNALVGMHGQGPESLRRRLMGRASSDLNAVLIQVKPGKGQTQLLQSKPAPAAAPFDKPDLETIPASLDPELETLSVAAEPRSLDQPETIESAAPQPEPMRDSAPVQAVEPDEPPEKEVASAPQPIVPSGLPVEVPPWDDEGSPESLKSAEKQAEQPGPQPAAIRSENPPSYTQVVQAAAVSVPAATPPAPVEKDASTQPKPRPDLLAGAGSRLAGIFSRSGRGLLGLFVKVIPSESSFNLPSPVMAFIAVAVPVLVVTIASIVFAQLGKATQFQDLYAQALEQATLTQGQSDPIALRTGWSRTLELLNQAEEYGTTTETRQLREYAQQALDEMDDIRRPDYQPAIIGGLPETVRITRLLIVDGDLYMLDANSGNVLRGLVTSSGYEVDRSFQCGPDQSLIYQIGPLIDIAPSPYSAPQSVVLGMDTNGGMLNCFLNQPPEAYVIALPDRLNSGELVGLTEGLGNVFVLDPLASAVWIYFGSAFEEQPVFFFGDQVPPMQDVIDLAVEKDDLYLLHADGHMTICTYSSLSVSPTRCNEPVPYMDFRVVPVGEPFEWPNPFTQVITTQPPDPSLYMFDPKNQAILHFSLRNLAFQRMYFPKTDLGPLPATAFTVNPLDRTIYLAINDRVYYANLP
jgi:hypothetical protein